MGGLLPAIDELKEKVFVGFGNRGLIGQRFLYYSAKWKRFYGGSTYMICVPAH
jgi:hypothetical protein